MHYDCYECGEQFDLPFYKKNKVGMMDGNFYDLMGRKVGDKPTRAGVYIKNGSKVVIK